MNTERYGITVGAGSGIPYWPYVVKCDICAKAVGADRNVRVAKDFEEVCRRAVDHLFSKHLELITGQDLR